MGLLLGCKLRLDAFGDDMGKAPNENLQPRAFLC